MREERPHTMTAQETIELSTNKPGEMHDITGEVEAIVARSGVTTGVAHVFNVGSTGVVGAIEYESGLVHDLPNELKRLIPPSRHYGHEEAWHDGNGHSHLQATMMGPDLTVPVSGGHLVLGTWQQVFHLECDIKARRRTLVVTVMGD